jgi:CRP/FNR family transcriptional regulator, anaerobic regulatory protein
MENLISFMQQHFVGFDDTIAEAIKTNFKKKVLQKGELLIQKGKLCDSIFFIEKGQIRNYFTKDGVDITTWFFFPNDFVTIFHSLHLKQSSREFTEAVTNCELYYISFNAIENLCRSSHKWEHLYRMSVIQFALQQEERIFILHTMDAKERYAYLMKNNPALIQSAPNKFIASYLGMTRETLSRIKGKR